MLSTLFSYSGRINRMQFFMIGCVTPLLVLVAFAIWAIWMVSGHFGAMAFDPMAIVSDSLAILFGFILVMGINGTITWAAVFRRARDIDGTTLHAKLYLGLTIAHPIVMALTYGGGLGASILMSVISLAMLGYIGFFLLKRGQGAFDLHAVELEAFGALPSRPAVGETTSAPSGAARLDAALQDRLRDRAQTAVAAPAHRPRIPLAAHTQAAGRPRQGGASFGRR